MPDQKALDACDFTNAELKGAADAGEPYYEYKIEGDHNIGDVLYFASKEGCTDGQKAAVRSARRTRTTTLSASAWAPARRGFSTATATSTSGRRR